jgi:signal peptidase I
VDGQARDEVAAFERNAAQEGEYVGYKNIGALAVGASMKVPENKFVALGDNSANSADSRYWGYVPQESVVGRAIFIYYPFTKRWGPSE